MRPIGFRCDGTSRDNVFYPSNDVWLSGLPVDPCEHLSLPCMPVWLDGNLSKYQTRGWKANHLTLNIIGNVAALLVPLLVLHICLHSYVGLPSWFGSRVYFTGYPSSRMGGSACDLSTSIVGWLKPANIQETGPIVIVHGLY